MEDLVLAFIGDAAYELDVRIYLTKYYKSVNKLQEEAVKLVSAKSQRNIINKFMEKGILKEEELNMFRRGRNTKVKSNRKDIVTYKVATGFETMLGYLYENDKDRYNELMKEVFNYYESIR